ncbi:MAG: tetratricopeptide repeat protein, partial [Pirellulaceae bacterium]
ASQIATAGPDQVRAMRSPEWDRAWQELLDRHHANRDRSGAHLGLGLLAEQMGKPQQAIEHYRDALRLEPQATGPRSNLAVLYDVMADSVSGERLTAEDEKLKESWRQQATKMRSAIYSAKPLRYCREGSFGSRSASRSKRGNSSSRIFVACCRQDSFSFS